MEPCVVSAVDPETGDRAPIELGQVAARLLSARLIVVVVRPGGSAPERLARIEPGRDRAGVVASLRAALRGQRTEVREVSAPSPAAGLHAVLAAERPVLAVVGSPHDGVHGSVGLGGTTERLLTATACPVAIAPRGYVARPTRPLTRIAAAVVPSPEGRATLRAGACLAGVVGTPLHVLMVLSTTPGAADARAIAQELAPGFVATALDQDAADVLASAIAAGAGGGPLQIEASILVGDPADALVRASRRADVLLLGSRAYGPAHAVLAGGVARRVLEHACCPLVLLPRDDPADRGPAFATAEAVGV